MKHDDNKIDCKLQEALFEASFLYITKFNRGDKMANSKNNNPVLFDLYDQATHIAENRIVYDGCIDMGGLPDSYIGVTVTDSNNNRLVEITDGKAPEQGEFSIDYKHGWLYVDPTTYYKQTLTLDFYSRGIELTPASRIYTIDANGCIDLNKTLQTYIDEVNGHCKFEIADEFENLESGDSFNTMFGKLARWYEVYKAHISATSDRHKAADIDYSEDMTAEEKIDSIVETANEHKTAAVLDHPDGSVTTAKIANNAVNVIKRDINVYAVDLDKKGDGNNILYITIDGITDYAQLTGKTIGVDTKAYQCTWETPQAVYLNVNGLGAKNIFRSLPCNYADYDTQQYQTNLFTQYEIGRSNVLLLTYDSSSFILSNPPVPPKATKAITASTTDDGSYVTPKKVADFVNTKADKVTNGGFIAGSNASNGIGGVAIGDGAATDTGVAIGKSAASTDGGIAIGKDAVSQGSGGAVGYNAHETEGGGAVGRDSGTNMGGAIGYGAVSTGGGAVGNSARSTTGGAVGESASTNAGGAVGNGSSSESGGAVGENAITDTGGAIGKDAVSGNGFSGGKSAKVAANADDTYIDAIQLGTGTNDTPKTMQVYNKRIVEADGSLTDVGDLTKLSTSVKTNIVNAINSVINIEFFNPNAYRIIFNNITKIGDKRYKADVTLSGAYLKYKLWDTTYEGMNRTYKNFSFSVDNTERCGLWLDIDMLGQRNETCQLFGWELEGSDSSSITIGHLDNGQYLQFHLCDFEIIDGDTDNPIDVIYNGYDHSVIGIFEIIGGYLDSKAAKTDVGNISDLIYTAPNIVSAINSINTQSIKILAGDGQNDETAENCLGIPVQWHGTITNLNNESLVTIGQHTIKFNVPTCSGAPNDLIDGEYKGIIETFTWHYTSSANDSDVYFNECKQILTIVKQNSDLGYGTWERYYYGVNNEDMAFTEWVNLVNMIDAKADKTTVANEIKDTNKYGLKVGDILNGDYIGFSARDLQYIHDKLLSEKTSIAEPIVDENGDLTFSYNSGSISPVYSYDLSIDSAFNEDEQIFVKPDAYISLSDATYDSSKKAWYSGGTLQFVNCLPQTGAIVKLTIPASYDSTFEITSGDCSVYPSSSISHTQYILCSAENPTGDLSLSINLGNWVWFSAIEIYSVSGMGFTVSSGQITVNRGDSAGLINALKFAPSGSTIYIPDEIYNVGCCDNTSYTGILHITADNITIEGESRENTIITGYYDEDFSVVNSVIRVDAKYVTLKNFTVISQNISRIDEIYGQAPAVADYGTDTVWKNVAIIGGQDTLVTGSGSQYFSNCLIEGTVDFVCGGDTEKLTCFSECTLLLKGRSSGNVICAPQGNILFESCTIDDNGNYEFESQNGKYSLARAWGQDSAVRYYNTKFNILPNAEAPYTSMSTDVTFTDYGDTGGVDALGNTIENYHTPADSSLLTNKSIWFEDWNDVLSRATN